MTDDERTMREWLDHPDKVRRDHARYRLAAGFNGPAEPPRVEAGIFIQAASYAAALASHALAGFPASTPELVEARLAACEACVEHLVDRDLGRDRWRCGGAGGCGCNVEAKAGMAGQLCPLGKWPADVVGGGPR